MTWAASHDGAGREADGRVTQSAVRV